eukprot:1182911-Prorocentrum_minimum.AAC.9
MLVVERIVAAAATLDPRKLLLAFYSPWDGTAGSKLKNKWVQQPTKQTSLPRGTAPRILARWANPQGSLADCMYAHDRLIVCTLAIG